ncbi:DUF2269 family protein [Caulobacter henricii]|uniref:DUF2269 domain-containing protein n=1 Tax=Caulobacter henricii TaxID=69395 RepID=A0A0P0P3B0_9CAUL|nr:DUF2269 domain-containing protein [Caulobacter henricii]ALL14784.1 hypothetical protein AQ619_16220 [Caulobacter henricii]
MDLYTLLKVAHVIGAAVLLGTGAGIAFFMLMAHRSRDPAVIAHTAGIVVLADTVFTASAVILQPITGAALAHLAGYPLLSGWIGLSLVLYVVTGLCWLPVVWIQIRLRDLALQAAESGAPLPERYFRLFRLWFVLGFPAFAAVLGIVWLMVAKPAL